MLWEHFKLLLVWVDSQVQEPKIIKTLILVVAPVLLQVLLVFLKLRKLRSLRLYSYVLVAHIRLSHHSHGLCSTLTQTQSELTTTLVPFKTPLFIQWEHQLLLP